MIDDVTEQKLYNGQDVCFWSRKRGNSKKISICGIITSINDETNLVTIDSNAQKWEIDDRYVIPKKNFDPTYFDKKANLYPPTTNQTNDYQISQTSIIDPITEHDLIDPLKHTANIGQCLDGLREFNKRDPETDDEKTRYTSNKKCVETETNKLAEKLNTLYNVNKILKVSLLEGKLQVNGQGVSGYHFGGDGGVSAPDRVFLNIRTDKRNHIVSKKNFLGTFLHEWMHQHDSDRLKIKYPYHTKGYFQRINTVYNQLKRVYETENTSN